MKFVSEYFNSNPSCLALAVVFMIAAISVLFIWHSNTALVAASIFLMFIALILSVRSMVKQKSDPFAITAVGLITIILVLSTVIIFSESSKLKLEYLLNNILLSKWDWVAFIIASASLVFAACTWVSQEQTKKNTMRISPDIQRSIFIDYFRHSYRNIMVIYALHERLKNRLDDYYPSEEHIIKIKTDISAIYPEAFISDPGKCALIHNFMLVVRNANIELDIAIRHLVNKNISSEIKERDLSKIKSRIEYNICRTMEILDSGFSAGSETITPLQHVTVNAIDIINNDTAWTPYLERAKRDLEEGRIEPLYTDAESQFIMALFPDGDQEKIKSFLNQLNIHIWAMLYRPGEIALLPYNTSLNPIIGPE